MERDVYGESIWWYKKEYEFWRVPGGYPKDVPVLKNSHGNRVDWYREEWLKCHQWWMQCVIESQQGNRHLVVGDWEGRIMELRAFEKESINLFEEFGKGEGWTKGTKEELRSSSCMIFRLYKMLLRRGASTSSPYRSFLIYIYVLIKICMKGSLKLIDQQ
jgi:hypothetical protein